MDYICIFEAIDRIMFVLCVRMEYIRAHECDMTLIKLVENTSRIFKFDVFK